MSDLFRPAQLLSSYSLAGSGAVLGDVSVTLKSMLDIGGIALTMAGTFGDIGYATIEPGSGALEEQISFTGLTNNSSGTVTLTGVSSVSFTYPYTETSGLSKTHAGSTVLVVSNTSGYYNQFPAKKNDETITGVYSFTAVPNAPAPSAGTDLTNKDYVLSVVNGGPVTYTSVIVSAEAGETVASGNLLYFDETADEWKKTDADTLASVKNTFLGIAQGSGTVGGAITGGVLIYGLDGTQTGMTKGDIMYASNTAGGISATVGTTPAVVGIARTATSLFFNPYFQHEFYAYAVDAVGTDSYAITLSATFNAYYPGMVVSFKAGTANTGACTLNINGKGAKTIKKTVSTDLETGDILLNQIVTVIYDGTNFQLATRSSLPTTTTTVYTGNSTWIKSATVKYIQVIAIGAGGGGGSGKRTGSGNFTGGSGGGGGAVSIGNFVVTNLNATVAITVGTAGTAGVAQTGANTNGNPGTGGGSSSFGAWIISGGGGGGPGGTDAAVDGGGGGGTFSSGSGATAGLPSGTAGAGASGGQGASTSSAGVGQCAEYGGASGGSAGDDATSGQHGGSSVYGGPGGGSGGANNTKGGGSGGSSGSYTAGTGGAGGSTDGSSGTAGSDNSVIKAGYGGSAGGGGGGSTAGNGGTGGAGGIPGAGGGGGGAAGGSQSGAGGAGGRGQVTIIEFY